MSSDGRPSLFVAQVLFDYDAQASEEISLKEGQFCHVLETNDAGWWLVREANSTSGGKSGWAPSNFLRRLEADEIGLAAGIQAITPVHKVSDRKPSVHRVCHKCQTPVTASFALAGGRSYHVPCFTCAVCNVGLAGTQYFTKDDSAYCQKDYFQRFGQSCAACGATIFGPVITALTKHWHPEHFACAACKKSIVGTEFFVGSDEKPYCAEDYRQLFGVRCAACQNFITGSSLECQGASYHVTCFRCSVDEALIAETDPFHVKNGAIFCQEHFQERFLERCDGCQKPISDQYVKIMSKTYHVECFRCEDCDVMLSSSQFQLHQDMFLCATCTQVRRTRKERESEINERIPPVKIESTSSGQAREPRWTTQKVPPREQKPEVSNQIITKPAEASGQKQKFEFQRDGSGQIRMKAADLVGKDRPLPEEIDRLHKENYLSDEEFLTMFGMNREQFAVLRPWKQQQIKQQIGLF